MIREIVSITYSIVISAVLTVGSHPAGVTAATPATESALRLPRIFGDGMVLQREQPIPFWGWAAPGSAVTVTLRVQSAQAKTGANGAWHLELPAMIQGGPYDVTIAGSDGKIVLHDVLIGDVWVASGQSNMEFTVSQGNDAAQEIALARDSHLRQFKVPNSWANAPEHDLAGGSWAPADSAHVGTFTGVGYFFARELRAKLKVPIGIINTTWGGSAIEAWMSRDAQGITEASWNQTLHAEEAKSQTLHDTLLARLGVLPLKDMGMVDGRPAWADPTLVDADWPTMIVPAYWEPNGYPGLDGVAWYRLSFALSESEARAGVTLSMAAIDDDDITWVNGVEIGRTEGYNKARLYTVPSSALHAGINLLAVRVTDSGDSGGINGAVKLISGGTSRSLAGTWRFRVGEVIFHTDSRQINKVPTVLYNRMVYPILPFAIKGVIWYQGESNANDLSQARRYRGQFAKLVDSWREDWAGASPRLPFLWVQLPNYGKPDSLPPVDATWASQRESMSAELSVPLTGQAITIDVGEAENLHPKNKQDVGKRLALVALDVAYGEGGTSSGPTFRSFTTDGGKAIVTFEHLGKGLMSKSPDGSVGAFAIAGDDRVWHWANAKIVGKTVQVWSDQVPEPTAVRYAYSNGPLNANLYNKDGLPAAPFRTDKW
jgi:sialate O-acetylesterase